MAVYLLHFHERLSHAQHYIGFADGNADAVDRRVKRHRKGGGAKIMAAVKEAGIEFTVARVWLEGDRALERQLKRRKNARSLCPCCQAESGLTSA